MDMIFFEMPSGVDAFPFASRVVGKRPFTLAVHPRWIPVASAPDPDAQVPTVPRFQTPTALIALYFSLPSSFIEKSKYNNISIVSANSNCTIVV
jgi:hypothetical protein